MSDAEKAAEAHIRLHYFKDHDGRMSEIRFDFLAGYAAAMQWRGIESAPRDGTKILAMKYDEPESIEITEWCVMSRLHYEPAGDGLFRQVNTPHEFWDGNGHRATHWMPLPLPPSETFVTGGHSSVGFILDNCKPD